MTSSEFKLFLTAAIGICALMAVFTLARLKTRGPAAYTLSAAFLFMGLLMYLVREEVSRVWQYVVAGVVFLLLVADFLVRSGQYAAKRGDKK